MTAQKKCDLTYGQTDRQTDGQRDGQMVGRTDGQTDGQMDEGEVIPKCHPCLQQVTRKVGVKHNMTRDERTRIKNSETRPKNRVLEMKILFT